MSRFTVSAMRRGSKIRHAASKRAKKGGSGASTGLVIRLRRPKGSRPKHKKPSRIGKHWKNKPDVIVYADKRQRCNPGTVGGRREYYLRKLEMHDRQRGLCCICRKPLELKAATFEHERGRNAQRIDERIWVNALPQNGVSHEICNSKRGSKRTKIYHYPQHEVAA